MRVPIRNFAPIYGVGSSTRTGATIRDFLLQKTATKVTPRRSNLLNLNDITVTGSNPAVRTIARDVQFGSSSVSQ